MANCLQCVKPISWHPQIGYPHEWIQTFPQLGDTQFVRFWFGGRYVVATNSRLTLYAYFVLLSRNATLGCIASELHPDSLASAQTCFQLRVPLTMHRFSHTHTKFRSTPDCSYRRWRRHSVVLFAAFTFQTEFVSTFAGTHGVISLNPFPEALWNCFGLSLSAAVLLCRPFLYRFFRSLYASSATFLRLSLTMGFVRQGQMAFLLHCQKCSQMLSSYRVRHPER